MNKSPSPCHPECREGRAGIKCIEFKKKKQEKRLKKI